MRFWGGISFFFHHSHGFVFCGRGYLEAVSYSFPIFSASFSRLLSGSHSFPRVLIRFLGFVFSVFLSGPCFSFLFFSFLFFLAVGSGDSVGGNGGDWH